MEGARGVGVKENAGGREHDVRIADDKTNERGGGGG